MQNESDTQETFCTTGRIWFSASVEFLRFLLPLTPTFDRLLPFRTFIDSDRGRVPSWRPLVIGSCRAARHRGEDDQTLAFSTCQLPTNNMQRSSPGGAYQAHVCVREVVSGGGVEGHCGRWCMVDRDKRC